MESDDKPVTLYVITFPTFKALYPDTREVKALSVATSRMYPVGLPVLAAQFAVNEVAPPDVAALAEGMEGVEFTVKLVELVAAPPEVVMAIAPVVPEPTTTEIDVLLFIVIELTAVPPIVTAVVDERLVPVIFIVDEFAHPLEGVKEVIVGVGHALPVT